MCAKRFRKLARISYRRECGQVSVRRLVRLRFGGVAPCLVCVFVCLCLCFVRAYVEGDDVFFVFFFCVYLFVLLRSAISLPALFSCWFVWAMLGFARICFIYMCTCQAVAGSSPIVNVRLTPPASLPGMGEQV